MFRVQYIHDLVNGQLSEDGYKHFILVVQAYIKKYRWPKSIITQQEATDSGYWNLEEIKEVTHQFFEWCLLKGKLAHIGKIPSQYLSYYFSQILISFVANRIKEQQQKDGVSFARCRDLVHEIIQDQYFLDSFSGKQYVFYKAFSKSEIRPISEIENAIKYLSKIPIGVNTKQIKPLVKLAIDDVLGCIDAAIPVDALIKAVYHLLDQKHFRAVTSTEAIENESEIEPKRYHQKYVQEIVGTLTKDDAKIVARFIFKNEENLSLANMAAHYGIPKSTFHHKIDGFKKKVARTYRPENEQDAVSFLKNLSDALDEHSK